VDEALIRQLARLRGAPVVTSLYLDLEGRRLPRLSDYVPHLDALARTARRRAAVLGPAKAEAVEADLQRISGWFAAGVDRRATRGVALFSSAGRLFEVVEVPVAVRDQIALGPRPDVAQLCEVLPRCEPVLVVVLDWHRSRLLRVVGAEVDEVERADGAPERRVDTDLELGSWSRQHEEQARRHVRRVAGQLARELDTRPAERVVLAGTPEVLAGLEACLARRVRERVIGTATLAVTASPNEVGRVTAAVLRLAQSREQTELVEALRDRAEQRRGAVTGLEATLGALADGEVTRLMVEPRLHASGARCPACDQLTLDAARCPRCGAQPVPEEDVVDAAVTDACAQHVEIELCESAALEKVGGIGAVLRA
jgi:hypothetical protein